MLGKLKAMISAVNKRIDNLPAPVDPEVFRPDSDNTWTSSTAYTDISGLTFTPELNALYRIDIMTVFTAGTAEDFRFRMTRSGLSDADLRVATTATASGATNTWNSSFNSAGNGISTVRIGNLFGYLKTGVNAGDVIIQGSQQASGANTTTLYTQTSFIYTRLA